MDHSSSDASAAVPAKTPWPRPSPKRKRGLLWLVLFLLAVGGGIAGYVYYRRQQPALNVQTEPVRRRNLTEIVVATGKIQPVLQVKISPEVSGEIIVLSVKEGQVVKKGDLLLRIKPDFYIANTNSAHAAFLSAHSGQSLARANWSKAEAELKRHLDLLSNTLISASVFLEVKTSHDVAQAQHQTSVHQVEMSRASLARAEEELAKTIIYAPISGTISRLNSQVGERVVGTATMAGTEVMTIANLEDMEARVDIGEVDIVLIALGQKALLEVDAFQREKFAGEVYEIANSAKTTQPGQQQEATKFEVKIRITEKKSFLPGMSVTADIQTRHRTNVLTVPIQCVTTRLPKGATPPNEEKAKADGEEPEQNGRAAARKDENTKPLEVVFVAENKVAKMIPVVRGISDDSYLEIKEGLKEGQEVISGSYKAINRELEEGKAITVTPPPAPSSDAAKAPPG